MILIPVDRGCLREVSTTWQYINLHETSYKATLPGDVVEVNLQVKTTRGFHKVKRDAWGAHTHSYQRWGTQIQPTPTTARQISKFQKQWMEYLERSTRQQPSEDRDARMAQQGRGIRVPRAYTFSMPRSNSNTPWVVRQAERGILPPPRRASPQPSPVAEPLSHMAQLAAGMLPLGKPNQQDPAPPSSALGGPPTTAATRPLTPPMTFPPSENHPLDLSYKEQTRPDAPTIKTSPITSDEESVPDLVEETTSFSPVIRKVETISVTEYNNMPSEETESKHVRFQEPPTSPSPQTCEEEEEMEIQEAAPVKQNPPKEPEVLVISPKSDSEDSEVETLKKVIKERATAWEKRRERAQRKKLILRIKKNSMGPNTLEVYRGMPPTPMEAPAQLFPEVKAEEIPNED